MRRAFVVLAAMAAAVWLCLVPANSPNGRVEAADEGLTAEAKAKLDASLIVFVGEVAELGPAPAKQGAGSEGVQWVAYNRVAGVFKGTSSEDRFVVENVVREHPDPSGPGLDPKFFATGQKLILGVQLHRGPQSPNYTLRNTFGPFVMTDPLVREVLQYVDPVRFVRASAKQQQTTCMINLTELAQIYMMEAQENRAKAQKYSGVALWLRYRKGFLEIKRGDERVLLCPADPRALFPNTEEERKLFDDVDLENPRPGLCSYAGRDFARCPLPFGDKPQPIGACLHHPGGAIIAFDSGDVQLLTLKELGLDSDAEKIVGPDSKSPLLRVLR